MILYPPDQLTPVSLITPHDPNEITDYSILWGDFKWIINGIYEIGDRVVPTNNKGIVATCVVPGVSSTIEPIWVTAKGTRIVDGTVTWRIDYSLSILDYNENVASSVWSTDNISITISNDSHSTKSTTAFVSTVPATLTSFILTNRITTDSVPPRTYERSISVPVAHL